MFARLMPHEGRFFDYFTEHAALIREGALELKAMMDNMGETESRAHNIKTIEPKADTVTYEPIQLLHTTFITPIDRDEIHQLITRMDDILDLMEDVSQSVFLYEIRKIPDERSEEHTSELQSLRHLVCRLLLEKKKQCPIMVQKHEHT